MSEVERWGSAILAKREFRLVKHPEATTYWERYGLMASGTVTLADGSELSLGSVHAPVMKELSEELFAGHDPATIKLEAYPGAYYYDVPYAIYRNRNDARFLISGDWNVSPDLWDKHHPNMHEADFFARARADGWVDCYRQFHDEEGQTWFRKNDRPYQLDHAFCDTARLDGCSPATSTHTRHRCWH